ncbi:hypothetical protein CERZMDRAFT_105621, partial [Cercospora zeae-maydis SCOH1-5]
MLQCSTHQASTRNASPLNTEIPLSPPPSSRASSFYSVPSTRVSRRQQDREHTGANLSVFSLDLKHVSSTELSRTTCTGVASGLGSTFRISGSLEQGKLCLLRRKLQVATTAGWTTNAMLRNITTRHREAMPRDNCRC